MISVLNLSFFVVFLYGIYYFLSSKKKYNLPPGPWNIPFVGGLHSRYPHVTYHQHAKQYGPLIRAKFGLQDALIIDDAQIMREAFNTNAFSGRVDVKSFTLLSGGKHGILNAEGPEWAEQRRFVLRVLRDFGFGKRSMENLIMEEIHEFLKWMKMNEGNSTEMKPQLVLATVSTLWTMLAGERQAQTDAQLRAIVRNWAEVFNQAGQSNGILLIFPQLIDILPKTFLKSWYRLVDVSQNFMQIFREAIQAHVQNPVDSSQPRDLIDVYLNEIEKTTDANSSFFRKRGVETLRVVLTDLYAAGQGTTSNILTWGVLYLVRNPHVQKKFQKELDNVIGRNRLPSLEDRPNLPYTEALIMEIIRFSSLTPLGVFHETTEDTTLGGYDIKKGTVVIPNVYSMDQSKTTYGDPENFRPERFLSTDELTVVKFPEFMPFGTGKRQCLGETMGRTNVFLFITSIFHQFEIWQDSSKPPPSYESLPGFIRQAEKFSVIFKERL